MTTIRYIDLDAASSLSMHRGSGRGLKGLSTYSLKHAYENDVVKPCDAVPIQNPEKPSRLKQSSLLQVTLLFAFTFHAELEHGPTWNFHFGAQYERTIVFNPDNAPEIQTLAVSYRSRVATSASQPWPQEPKQNATKRRATTIQTGFSLHQ